MAKEKNSPAGEVVDPGNLKEIVPSMNVGVPSAPGEGGGKEIISDDMLLGIYGEIVDKIKEDRDEIASVLNTFLDLVINEGDSTTSSKEALVNLLKMKSDQADKMAKVADLMTRMKLKQADTFPRYLAASQNNTINIGGSQKRALLEAINNMKKEKDKE
jgi:hypothetical protein